MQDSTAYYLIGYTSAQAPVDGKFHQIKVQLSAAARKRGLQVRARRGYWAATAEDVKKAEKATTTGPAVSEAAKPVLQALASIAVPVQSGKYVRTWLGTERGANGKTKVTLVWEPLPQPAGAARRDPVAGRVSLTAATEKGDLVYRGRTPDAPQLASANPQATGASASLPAATTSAAATPHALTFEAPPGKLEL